MNPEKITSVSVSGTADIDTAKSTQNTKPLPRQERFFMHVDGDHGRLSGRRALSGVGGCAGGAVGGKDIEVEERAWHGVREGGPGTRGSSSEGMMGSGPRRCGVERGGAGRALVTVVATSGPVCKAVTFGPTLGGSGPR